MISCIHLCMFMICFFWDETFIWILIKIKIRWSRLENIKMNSKIILEYM